MTYESLAYAIKNNVSDGLHSVNQFSYSIEQIIDEALLLRNRIIYEKGNGPKINIKFFTQKMSKIPISCEKLHGECSLPIDEIEMHISIPKPISTMDDTGIVYAGPMDNSSSFKLYYDDNYSKHKYRAKTAHKPYIYLDLESENTEGYINAYLFNMGRYREMKYMLVRGVFADPRLASMAPNFYQDEFAAPLEVQSIIIDQLTQKYVQYYRQLNFGPQANTQSSLTT